jgi:hypothetical protein
MASPWELKSRRLRGSGTLTAAIGFPDLSLASLNGAMPHEGLDK